MDTITKATRATRPITELELCAWLGTTIPGDRLAYHRGFLALDCAPSTGRMTERERKELLRVARRAMFAAENGLAHLIQHRNGQDCYTYFIVARPRPASERGSIVAILAEEGA